MFKDKEEFITIISIGKIAANSTILLIKEDYVQSNILEPAVKGTMNLLQACSRSHTMKRVIFTSSVSTITAKDDRGKWKAIVDESSTIQIDAVWKAKPNGWVCEFIAFWIITC